MRKNKGITMGLALVLAVSSTLTSFAGTWKTGEGANAGRYWYDWGQGSYPKSTWEWIDGNNDGTAECYYFDAEGWMLANTEISGSKVNADGAWVQNGKVQTVSADKIPEKNRGTASTAASKSGSEGNSGGSRWVQEENAWKYREGNGFATEKWVKISGNKYYFDEQSEMITGFAEIDGSRYYFKADGSLQTKTFQLDGTWYVLDDNDNTIIDEVDRDEWEVYRSQNGITNIDWSALGGTGYILNEDTDKNSYLSSNGMNDMKVVCAILGANGVTKSDLNKKEEQVYDVVKKFVSKKSLKEMSDYEKIVEITKFIWKKASYEKVGTDCYTPYGALVKKKTVCEGYARTFKLLCNCLGISCYVMDGWTSRVGHAWNGVMIDGEWYMIDVTETKSGLSEELAESILFNEEMVDQGFTFHYQGTTIYPNVRYYRNCDWSNYPSMDGTSYINDTYIRYGD